MEKTEKKKVRASVVMALADLQYVNSEDVMDHEEVAAAVKDLFKYHPWDDIKQSYGAEVRDALANAFLVVLANVPPGPTRSRALNCILDARMLANQAITFEGRI